MKIVSQFDYRKLDRVTNPDGSRFYTCPVSGNQLPSVTTVLDHTADKPGLLRWKEWVGEKRAQQERDEAAGLGTLLHTHLECHIQGLPRPRGNNIVRRMASQMADTIIGRGLAYVDQIFGFEVPVYYPALYAGTTDLIGTYKGRLAILDYKTTKTMKTQAQIEDYLLQTTAYALCHNHVFGTDINTVVILMVSRDLQFEQFVIEAREYDDAALRWTERFSRFHATAGSS